MDKTKGLQKSSDPRTLRCEPQTYDASTPLRTKKENAILRRGSIVCLETAKRAVARAITTEASSSKTFATAPHSKDACSSGFRSTKKGQDKRQRGRGRGKGNDGWVRGMPLNERRGNHVHTPVTPNVHRTSPCQSPWHRMLHKRNIGRAASPHTRHPPGKRESEPGLAGRPAPPK